MRQLILLMIYSFAAPVAQAHDLDENRATLVLRDRTHLSVTLYLNYAQALHRALLPHREYGAFLLMYSSMKPDDLEKELQSAQAKFELEKRMTPRIFARLRFCASVRASGAFAMPVHSSTSAARSFSVILAFAGTPVQSGYCGSSGRRRADRCDTGAGDLDPFAQ